ncbi:unnamed protein product [Amoebophrya sp. A25]|nr:unnamed protein product [Amoebophrya sp. A25]|eukprot:GSA25T00000274001.1
MSEDEKKVKKEKKKGKKERKEKPSGSATPQHQPEQQPLLGIPGAGGGFGQHVFAQHGFPGAASYHPAYEWYAAHGWAPPSHPLMAAQHGGSPVDQHFASASSSSACGPSSSAATGSGTTERTRREKKSRKNDRKGRDYEDQGERDRERDRDRNDKKSKKKRRKRAREASSDDSSAEDSSEESEESIAVATVPNPYARYAHGKQPPPVSGAPIPRSGEYTSEKLEAIGIHENPELAEGLMEWVEENRIDKDAFVRLRCLTVEFQMKVMQKGSVADVANPSNVLIARIRDFLKHPVLGAPRPTKKNRTHEPSPEERQHQEDVRQLEIQHRHNLQVEFNQQRMRARFEEGEHTSWGEKKGHKGKDKDNHYKGTDKDAGKGGDGKCGGWFPGKSGFRRGGAWGHAASTPEMIGPTLSEQQDEQHYHGKGRKGNKKGWFHHRNALTEAPHDPMSAIMDQSTSSETLTQHFVAAGTTGRHSAEDQHRAAIPAGGGGMSGIGDPGSQQPNGTLVPAINHGADSQPPHQQIGAIAPGAPSVHTPTSSSSSSSARFVQPPPAPHAYLVPGQSLAPGHQLAPPPKGVMLKGGMHWAGPQRLPGGVHLIKGAPAPLPHVGGAAPIYPTTSAPTGLSLLTTATPTPGVMVPHQSGGSGGSSAHREFGNR